MNQVYSLPIQKPLSVSTQDYLSSICQLARPAFAQREPDLGRLSLGSPASLRPQLRSTKAKAPTLPPVPPVPPVPRRDSPPTAPEPEQTMVPQPDTSYLREPKKIQGREGMEETCNPETVGLTLGKCVTNPGCRVADPLEVLYGNEDSVLTAARLARQSWKAERRERELPRRQAAQPDPGPHHAPPSSHSLPPLLAPPAQTHAPPRPQAPPRRSSPPVSLKGHCDGGEKTGPGAPPRASAPEPPPATRPSSVGAFPPKLLQTLVEGVAPGSEGRVSSSQPGSSGVVLVRISGCRSSFRQRRASSRSSFLPAIAEI